MGARASDPLLSYQFSVEVSQDPFGFLGFMIPIKGYFSEISGIGVEYETMEYKTTNFVGLPATNQVLGRPVYSPITLRRGVTNSEAFWLWHQMLVLGAKPLLKPYVTITMYDRNYKMAAQWSVEKAWPSKVSGPEMHADSNDFLIEELTLVHGGVMRMYLEPGMQVLDVVIQALLP